MTPRRRKSRAARRRWQRTMRKARMISYVTLDGQVIPLQLRCTHGRYVGQPCPHCMGFAVGITG